MIDLMPPEIIVNDGPGRQQQKRALTLAEELPRNPHAPSDDLALSLGLSAQHPRSLALAVAKGAAEVPHHVVVLQGISLVSYAFARSVNQRPRLHLQEVPARRPNRRMKSGNTARVVESHSASKLIAPAPPVLKPTSW